MYRYVNRQNYSSTVWVFGPVCSFLSVSMQDVLVVILGETVAALRNTVVRKKFDSISAMDRDTKTRYTKTCSSSCGRLVNRS